MNYLPYLNRTHSYTGDNCLSIIAEIYEKELNIPFTEERQLFNNFCFQDLKEIRRIPLEKVYSLENWIKIQLTQLQEFDIIVYTRNLKISHFNMYAGSYKFLDLIENQKSVLRHFNDIRTENIDGIIRHKQLVT